MIKKQVLKGKPVCKVTFSISKKEANGASSATIAGSFNDWDKEATPMTQLKNGTFKIVLPLATGEQHQFRYLLDGENWMNDPEADAYVSGGVGDEENSVVSL